MTRNSATQLRLVLEGRMNHDEVAGWIAERYGDRLSKPTGRIGGRWRLDGAITNASSIWMRLVYPAIEAGEISIDFKQNSWDFQTVMAKVMFKKWELSDG